jgi:hypothetical protein
MRETDLIKMKLLHWLTDRQSSYVITNYFLGNWECDIMTLSKDNFTTEYEIKTSRADYKKDFEKCCKSFGAVNQKWSVIKTDNKHEIISNGHRTNKFFFVTPTGLLKKEEIPLHAGLIEIGKTYYDIEIIKNPKWLHHNKVSDKIFKDLIDKFYNRYMFDYYRPKLFTGLKHAN